jgi:hypothetical protein
MTRAVGAPGGKSMRADSHIRDGRTEAARSAGRWQELRAAPGYVWRARPLMQRWEVEVGELKSLQSGGEISSVYLGAFPLAPPRQHPLTTNPDWEWG